MLMSMMLWAGEVTVEAEELEEEEEDAIEEMGKIEDTEEAAERDP